MREMELEEGEAPLLYSDDDENIDPDKDFSYIDKKIQDVLGQYRLDFMGDFSAENLGARFGGYGSFLPAYQRSPSTLTHPRNQSRLSSRSPQTMLEGASVNSVQTNGYPLRTLDPSNDSAVQSLSVPGMDTILVSSLAPGTDDAVQSSIPGTKSSSFPRTSVTESLVKHQNSGAHAANKESKCLPRSGLTQNSLRFRVKVVSDGVRLPDKSAIYSGLGLDMSPSSSAEDSPSEVDEVSPMEERPDASPSYIIEIMTSFHVPAGKLISPLRGSLCHLVEFKSCLENGRPSTHQVVSLDVLRESAPSPKKTEANRGRKGRQKDNIMEVVKIEEDKYEHQADNPTARFRWSEGTELPMNDEDVSKQSVDSFCQHVEVKHLPGLVDNSGGSCHSFASNGKGKVEHIEEDTHKPLKQHIAKDEAKKLDPDSVSNLEGGLKAKERVTKIGDMVRKDKGSSIPKNPVSSGEGNDDSSSDSIKPLRQEGIVGFNRRVALNSICLPGFGVKDEKDAYGAEIIPKHKNASSSFERDSEENGEVYKVNHSVSRAMKDPKNEPGELSIGIEAATKGKKSSSSGSRKKSKKSQKADLTAGSPNLYSSTSPSRVQTETTLDGGEFPSRSRKDELEPEMPSKNLKDCSGDMEGKANFRKKEKIMDDKYTIHGSSVRGNPPSSSKLKVRSGGKDTGYPFNVGPTPSGDRSNGNLLMEGASASVAPKTENASIYDEFWVQCDKCEKWRLLPYGLHPSCLPKKWICRMLDWLPGMNKCSFREEETTNALLIKYRIPAPAPEMQNFQPGGFTEGAPVAASEGNQQGVAHGQTSTMESLPSGEAIGHGQRQTKDMENGLQNPKRLSQSSVDANSVRKSAEVNPLKTEKKREADGDAYGAPRSAKRAHQQFKKEENHAGSVSLGTRDGQNRSTSSSEVSKDFVPGSSYSSVKKTKDQDQGTSNTMYCEVNDAPGKKRKMKDEYHRQSSIDFPNAEERSSMDRKDASNWVPGRQENAASDHVKGKNKRRSKGSDSREKEHSSSMLGDRDNSARCEDNAFEDKPSARLHGSNQKAVEGANSFKRGPESGLPSSNASKPSSALKVKHHEPKSSPVHSISSYPIKASELHNEHEESSPVKKPKIDVPHDEKSTRMSTPGSSKIKNENRVEDLRPKSAGEEYKQKHQSGRGKEKQHAFRKSASPFVDRIDSSSQNLASDDHGKRSLNLSDRAEPKIVAHSGSERGDGSCVSQFASTSKKRDEIESTAVDIADAKLPKPPAHSDVRDRDGGRGPTPLRARQSSVERNGAKGVETSSSSRKDSSHNPALLLKEATELKHTADRLKKSVSIRDAAAVFFQSAMKFLIGASYPEPGGTEAARSTRDSPDGVCRSTGDLCDYWAREFDKCNEVAFAAMAYKCKEVAYMRVVYSNSVTASRYQQDLQNAIKPTPQVDSPSSSASDVDNLTNQAAAGPSKDPHLPVVHGSHVLTAGVMPNIARLLSYSEDVSRAMDAARKSQRAFSDAHSSLSKAGNAEGISVLKRVLDFSFHDLSGLQRLVSLATEALGG